MFAGANLSLSAVKMTLRSRSRDANTRRRERRRYAYPTHYSEDQQWKEGVVGVADEGEDEAGRKVGIGGEGV